MVSRPASTSRTMVATVPLMVSFEQKVACGRPQRAASMGPVWAASSSMACLPTITRSGCSVLMIASSACAAVSGSIAWSVLTKMARSAPMASAVRNCCWASSGPMLTAMISVASPRSLMRSASSRAISSKGLTLILTPSRATPEPSGLTRTRTL